ncbi:MAG: sialidase family protein [Candidatus Latescibacterota bacterium]
MTRPEKPLPRSTPQQWFRLVMPLGYDKSQYLMEAVILESKDDLHTWEVISRQPYRHHHAVHQFGTARTADGRFLRFIWAGYSLEESVQPNEILYASSDNCTTWEKRPPFHHPHFVSYAHRLRTLKDGTLVVCVPLGSRWGTPERPTRTTADLNALGDMQMTLFFSFDQGDTWEGPLPIHGGDRVSETDFVELPSGDLLCISNSIFAHPGRQRIYREGHRFTPGPMEQASGLTKWGQVNQVPETACLTEEGLLIGCMRAGEYSWSDDLSLTWQPLEGIPDVGPQVYQPWIYCLADGRIACAGHYGRDAPITGANRDDQYLSIHFFRVAEKNRAGNTKVLVKRDYEAEARHWRNTYTLSLLCEGQPLAGRKLEFWYVGKGEPGYESFANIPFEERKILGGRIIQALTGPDGKAHIDLSHLDAIEDTHHSIQFVASFNADRAEPGYKAYQTCRFEQYSKAFMDPPLE